MRRLASLLFALALATAACSSKRETVTTLGVPGRANQTPSVTVDGSTIAVSWVSVGADSKADGYVAVSRDDGATFGSPVRVNDQEGEVRASEQQAPRVALRAGTLAVLWTAKRGNDTSVRVALSKDFGRTFAPSIALSPDGAPGTRGWGMLALDASARVNAVWLDTRLAAVALAKAGIAAASAAPVETHTGGEHVHGGGKMSTRQDIYSAVLESDGRINERLLATDVCFCCKTAFAETAGGVMAAAWRDIYPGSIRDITFARLDSEPGTDRVRVSEDGWQIDGCPENGPAMAGDRSGAMHIVWPTLVPESATTLGVFYSSTSDGRAFAPRTRLDSNTGSAGHPSLAASPYGVVLAAWEVLRQEQRQIEVRVKRGREWGPVEAITTGASASSPAVAAVHDGFIIAYTRSDPGGAKIELRRLF